MLKTGLRIQQDLEGRINPGKVRFIGPVRMELLTLSEVGFLQIIIVNCGTPLDSEHGEIIDHAEKLSPQEQ
jgi:hypothetical protein